MKRLAWLLTLGLGTALATPAQSRYTSLTEAACQTLKTDTQGEYTLQRCSGLGGYKLLAEEGDLRQNIRVVSPGGRQTSLELWTLISSAFSYLGPRAEWRGRLVAGRFTPFALIVRLNASEDLNDPHKITSYLGVARLTPTPCLTARIAPGPDMNARARAEADRANTRPCLKSP